jgi:hypothetical protein
LANVVLVKKANRKWRACVDFTDLNKACPKDSFPLPQMDVLVDSITCMNLIRRIVPLSLTGDCIATR